MVERGKPMTEHWPWLTHSSAQSGTIATHNISGRGNSFNVWIITAIEIFDTAVERGIRTFLLASWQLQHGQNWHWLNNFQYEIHFSWWGSKSANILSLLQRGAGSEHSWQWVKVWGTILLQISFLIHISSSTQIFSKQSTFFHLLLDYCRLKAYQYHC